MKDINPRADQFPEYRQAVRELCAQFPVSIGSASNQPPPTRKNLCKP